MRVDQKEQLASLERDLSTVGQVTVLLEDDREDHARARLVYTRQQLGLFGDAVQAPELEIGRVLRILAFKRSLRIERDELDGRRVFCVLPSRVEVCVELLGAQP